MTSAHLKAGILFAQALSCALGNAGLGTQIVDPPSVLNRFGNQQRHEIQGSRSVFAREWQGEEASYQYKGHPVDKNTIRKRVEIQHAGLTTTQVKAMKVMVPNNVVFLRIYSVRDEAHYVFVPERVYSKSEKRDGSGPRLFVLLLNRVHFPKIIHCDSFQCNQIMERGLR